MLNLKTLLSLLIALQFTSPAPFFPCHSVNFPSQSTRNLLAMPYPCRNTNHVFDKQWRIEKWKIGKLKIELYDSLVLAKLRCMSTKVWRSIVHPGTYSWPLHMCYIDFGFSVKHLVASLNFVKASLSHLAFTYPNSMTSMTSF